VAIRREEQSWPRQFGTIGWFEMKGTDIALDGSSETPLYRQLAGLLANRIASGRLCAGERLPATRELAEQLGLNRTTISAAYRLLETEGLIHGHVGRGSFVAEGKPTTGTATNGQHASVLAVSAAPTRAVGISFANSRPCDAAFPTSSFQAVAREVIDSVESTNILQLGSPYGYAPLRKFLLEKARQSGAAHEQDDVIVTNGCQQALDLIARLLRADGVGVAIEDPGYHGLRNVLKAAEVKVTAAAVGAAGMDLAVVEGALQRSEVRTVLVTPDFQNPTGVSMPVAERKQLLAIARRAGATVIENAIYGELRYRGEPLPSLKQLDPTAQVLLLGSYSKVSFPGLRVGWVIGPRPAIARLAELKQISDLHSDQLSQAILLRFAESGELQKHIENTKVAGLDRLRAAIDACERFFPASAQFTRPDGGMNLWIWMPSSISIEALLARVEAKGVSFMPGRYFSNSQQGLRLSFGALSPGQIEQGIRIIGETMHEILFEGCAPGMLERSPAVV
jgi:DNA-binding transcriptional MocR family regulator